MCIIYGISYFQNDTNMYIQAYLVGKTLWRFADWQLYIMHAYSASIYITGYV